MIAEISKLAQGNCFDGNGLFIKVENQPELVGRIDDKPRIYEQEPILKSLEDACQKAFEKAVKENPNFKIDWFCRPKELR